MEWEWSVSQNDEGERFAVGFLLAEPCVNQHVAFLDRSGRQVAAGTTDEFGYFQLKLPAYAETVTPARSPQPAVG